MKETVKDWLKVLVLLLDEAAAVVLVLLFLWFFRIRIPLWIAIVGALLLGTLAFVVPKVVIPSFHARKVTGSEGMIGLEGQVIEPLTPVGIIRVEGELWKAKSVAGDVPADETVEIMKLNKLVLEVKRCERPSGD